MSGDSCPEGCKHRTFHCCAESGTHCDIHCICSCAACLIDRENPLPVGQSGGKILSGDIVGSHPGLPNYTCRNTYLYIFTAGAVEVIEKGDGFSEAHILYGGKKWKLTQDRPNGDPIGFANEILRQNPCLGDWYPENMVNDALRLHSLGYSPKEVKRRSAGKKHST